MITLSQTRDRWRALLIVNDDGRDILVQSDYDYPGVASSFGWWVGFVPAPDGAYAVGIGDFRSCPTEHGGTDGTIDCAACGRTATDFIAAARDWLDDHIGATADDPGYFFGDSTEGREEGPEGNEATYLRTHGIPADF
jgi:hypothetical protein